MTNKQINGSRWRFRFYCVASRLANEYRIVAVNKTHDGQELRYGWPQRSVGVELYWRRNTWFVGWELRRGA